jgi:hypothetical protein
MQLKALTGSAIETTEGQCELDKMPGLRGGRELTTTQVASLDSICRSWPGDQTREVPAKMDFYHGGRLCCSKNVGAQFIELASLSLRGARFLACASEQASQSPPPPVFARSHRRRSNLANCSEIATPRQVGARNDKSAWWWMKEAAARSWRRDLQEPVSSFYFGDGRESMTRFVLLPRLSRGQVVAGQDGADGEDHYRSPCGPLDNEGGGRSWAIRNTSNISGV